MTPEGHQRRRPWRWPWSRKDGQKPVPVGRERERREPGRPPAPMPSAPPADEAEALTMRQTRPAARWDRRPAAALDRQVRLLYRHLVGHWGASRDDLRVVSVPALLWLAPCVALASPERITVLARGRPDRRVQLYHVNRDQMVTFSAARLEPDVSAPWTHPLRRVLFEWLSRGVMVTGMDASLVGTGPEGWHTAEAQAVACALGCLVGVWEEPGAAVEQGNGPPPAWPASVSWPADLSPFAQAWEALATGPHREAGGAGDVPPAGGPHQGGPGSDGVTPDDGRWAWVILGASGPAVFEASGVSCLEAGGGKDAAPPPGVLPLWALPPAGQGAAFPPDAEASARSARVEEALGRLAAALARDDAAQVREAASALAHLVSPLPGQNPAGWLVLELAADGPVPGHAPGPRRAGVPYPLLCRRPRRRHR